MELAIANHPNDCLVCDKSQECELLKVARYVGLRQRVDGGLRRAKQMKPLDMSDYRLRFRSQQVHSLRKMRAKVR